VDNWKKPGTTFIAGSSIFADDIYVDTVNIQGQAVTFPRGAYTASSVYRADNYGTIQSLSFTATGAPLIITVSCSASMRDGNQGETASLRLLVNGSAKISDQVIGTAALIGQEPQGNTDYGIYGFQAIGTMTFFLSAIAAGSATILVQGRGRVRHVL